MAGGRQQRSVRAELSIPPNVTKFANECSETVDLGD